MTPERNPETGKRLIKIRGWFTRRGSSPEVPYFERKSFEERYIALPAHAFKDDATTDSLAISTEDGETFDPNPPNG